MRPLVIGIGELLWDVFPEGRRLGGAPANFAFHVSRLGCRGAVVSRVGDDANGRDALAFLDRTGVDRSRVQVDPDLPTSTVDVTVDPEGRPTYRIHRPIAWDAIACPDALRSWAPEAAAICYGSLACRDPRSRESILAFLACAGRGCLRVLDINLRRDCWEPAGILALLGYCDVLKLNEDEFPVVADLCGLRPDLQALRAGLGLRLVALTLGERGSILCSEEERIEAPGLSVPVRDTVGAGDAFTAALVAGLVFGQDLRTLQRRATRLSAFVCTQAGATPETADFLRRDPHFR
ncbi:carbohydrate kinase family protein [Mesoterricola sediminis]|uniref:Fructokinase n=1 Tax=Mesoterricola sediminis TaxID=2927980 RepID=A0AA48HAB8_9BACT|nr:carbohydrate kinase [Mesoterricola sediminis]BDU78808.1 fructokinase [Mesoterricola sediminis]